MNPKNKNMTLKEKFQEWHDTPTNETVEENILELEQIADDYAIEFAEWVYKQPEIKVVKKSGVDNFYMRMSSKELLEIFKKEKGL